MQYETVAIDGFELYYTRVGDSRRLIIVFLSDEEAFTQTKYDGGITMKKLSEINDYLIQSTDLNVKYSKGIVWLTTMLAKVHQIIYC